MQKKQSPWILTVSVSAITAEKFFERKKII